MAPRPPRGAFSLTDRSALLASIHAAPDDDAPRLVFADWLDEHGEPERAAFVRVQCELPRTRVHPNGHTDVAKSGHYFVNAARDCTRDDCRACQLRRRERELWHAASPRGWAVGFEDVSALFADACHLLLPTDSLATADPDPTRLPVLIVRRGFIHSAPPPTASPTWTPSSRRTRCGR
jgi:uncharacterized protein (TIGR02996 family)